MWFPGQITEAITAAKSQQVPLLVFVRQSGSDSDQMESLLNEADIRKLCEDNGVISLLLGNDSEAGKQFSQIYPVVCLPILFLIGTDGKPLEIVPGVKSKETLINQISSAIEMHCHLVDQRAKEADANPVHSPTRKDTPAPPGFLAAQNMQNRLLADPVMASGSSGPAERQVSLDEKLNRAQELLEQRRLEKARQEAEEEKEGERKRRQEGQAILKQQQERQEKEMLELAKERKETKQKDKEALQRIKEQIAQDRADKMVKYNQGAQEEKAKRDEEKRKKELERQEQLRELEAKRSSVARIQFRLPDGSFFNAEFSADAYLGEAVSFVTEECARQNLVLGTFHLLQMYPRKEFGDPDMEKTFRELQLAPSATLLVMPDDKRSMRTGGENSGFLSQIMGWILMPLQFVYQMFMNIFGGDQPRGRIENQPSADQRNDESSKVAGFSKKEGGVSRMNTGTSDDKKDDDDNATWNGNSTQQL